MRCGLSPQSFSAAGIDPTRLRGLDDAGGRRRARREALERIRRAGQAQGGVNQESADEGRDDSLYDASESADEAAEAAEEERSESVDFGAQSEPAAERELLPLVGDSDGDGEPSGGENM